MSPHAPEPGATGRVDRRLTPLRWDEAADLDKPPATIPEATETEVPAELRERIEALMSRYPDRRSAALPALDAAQRVHGWCSPEAIDQVAAVMRVTPAYLSSVATFYDMLRTEPLGRRYVYVCTSVACHLRNAKAVHDAIADEAREQGLEDCDIRQFECLGACDMAPMASIDGRYVGPLDVSDAAEVVAALKEDREVFPGRGLTDRDFELPWAQGEVTGGAQTDRGAEGGPGSSGARSGEHGTDGSPPTPPDTNRA
ncbi:MAG TPA: NAD(P)H-dependent oxidoreductase subunit E [Thermoleophilaceae bacterium]|nr:NAD(P)H-dependent oxidoreductase subunit E [Thermoleophilaceae bacterium]